MRSDFGGRAIRELAKCGLCLLVLAIDLNGLSQQLLHLLRRDECLSGLRVRQQVVSIVDQSAAAVTAGFGVVLVDAECAVKVRQSLQEVAADRVQDAASRVCIHRLRVDPYRFREPLLGFQVSTFSQSLQALIFFMRKK